MAVVDILPTKTVLFFSPHQDDELLSMGIDICNSINNGQDVHVILCTDGSKCIVRHQMADGKECEKHAGTHRYQLTEDDLVTARDKEFRDSCRALGVKDSNVHIPSNRFVDGMLTVCNGKELILQYLNVMGRDCVVCTLDPNHDLVWQHRDHKALGYAAVELFNEGIISEIRLFTEPYHSHFYHHSTDIIRAECRPVVFCLSEAIQDNIQNAVDAYSYWEPESGRYAVGYHDIASAFDTLLKNGKMYCRICVQDIKTDIISSLPNTCCRKLIVSMTSCPTKIHSVALSLETIYQQTLLPDKVVLLLAESHFPNKLKDMPDELVRLVNEENISIHWCDDDLKSPLKYFYAFREYSNALIITIDDNLLCHKQLIETLYVSWLFYPEAVSTARAHLILISASGEMLSFRLMPAEVDACVGKPSLQMVATNCAGALYPTKLFFKVLNLLDAKADIENKLELLEATKADIMKSLELTKQKAERAEKDKQNSMEELRNIKNGWSFKIGRVLTFLPRIIRDWMKS